MVASAGKSVDEDDSQAREKRQRVAAPKKQAAATPKERPAPNPEKVELKAQLERCAKANDLEGCKALLEKLTAVGGVDAACYNMLISSCAKQGMTAEAEASMSKMLEAGVRPDIASFNSTIDA